MITFALLVVYRLGFHIFLPGVDVALVKQQLEQATQTGGLGAIIAFAGAITGGALSEAALFSLGIMPYISASIIFSLLVKVIPQLEALSKEGEAGRKRINQYTRYATVILCLFQSLFVITYLRSGAGGQSLIVPACRDYWLFYVSTVVTLTTGTLFLMWLGEMITEFGIGNGISLIIMAGIISRMPIALTQFVESEILVNLGPSGGGRLAVTLGILKLLFFIALFVGVIFAVVLMQQSQRRIPIQQAKHTRGRRVYGGQKHFLPFRINAAGVMPVIFANSLLILPIALLSYVGLDVGQGMRSERGFWYITLTIGLIYFFTYFWTSLQFNPVEIANNMKEYGSFIPGIRPGRKTAEYLEEIMNRITLVGASFLAAITIFPSVLMHAMHLDPYLASFLGGTGILIVVGVALDVVQKVESHLLMRHYEGFIKRGKVKGRRS
jgi:preprotein translocase subunit SecY